MTDTALQPAMITFSTSDICDANDNIQILNPIAFKDFGGKPAFAGPAYTIKVFEDNGPLRDLVLTPGEGRVIVMDGAGSIRASLMGGNIAKRAADNGWAGIVIYGCVRDVAELSAIPIGIRAIGLFPRKTQRNLHSARVGGPVEILGTTVNEGDWVYADADGIVVAERPVHAG